MSRVTLRLRERPPARVDMAGITPARLAEAGDGRDRLRLWCGRDELALGDLFDIAGSNADEVVIEGACDRLDAVGEDMTGGTLRVEGDAGFRVARGLRGGSVHVTGSVGALAGSAMRGGTLVVDGDAGDSLGGPLAGERRGMSGGLILVRGDAGDRAGERMRRGTILIEGSAGAVLATRLIAGTIAVLGSVGAGCGGSMRRGSLLLAKAPASLPATFHGPLPWDGSFVALLTSSWRALDSRFARLHERPTRASRHLGDRAVEGLGEVLVMEAWRDA